MIQNKNLILVCPALQQYTPVVIINQVKNTKKYQTEQVQNSVVV